jgi:5-oxoprolinase (ATP-hydrolysing) subunit A
MRHDGDMTLWLDLNGDLGEGFGAWTLGGDDALLDSVTSANIACGFHAGDPAVMERTVRAALEHGVALGAHPGLPDLQGFGRREMAVTPGEAYGMVLYQTGALAAFARARGAVLTHVKPHGALYNRACRTPDLARAVARAVRDFDPALFLTGLSGSALLEAGRAEGLRVLSEVFADRGYEPDGSLTPRDRPGALVEDGDEAAARVLRMVREGVVRSRAGTDVAVEARTVCLHGDRPGAAAFARRLRRDLEAAGITVRAPERT